MTRSPFDVPNLHSNCDLQILVGLATAPLLVGLVLQRDLGDWIQQLGRSSEEIFRGERLPILQFPHPSDMT